MEQSLPSSLEFVDLASDCNPSELREDIEDLLLQVQYFLTFSTTLLFCELGEKKQRVREIFLYLEAMVEKCNYALGSQSPQELEAIQDDVYEEIDSIREKLTNIAWELEKIFPEISTGPTDPPLRILLESKGNSVPYIHYFFSSMDC